MSIIADLHIHSPYSRATSPTLQPETLHRWAQLKGIHLVGTGDFTHPRWLRELEEKLEPAEDGLWQLKPDLVREADSGVPPSCHGPVRFVLQGEISTIYKRGGRTRKIHHLVLLPDHTAVRKLCMRLERIGNLGSDGRPILGLDSRDLLETVLEASEDAIFIPAHVWTPWFSVFGSKSGFDALEECYGELSSHVKALETGLSSDPAMNWRWSRLDRFRLISNSDAHSPAKLGREANLLEIPFSYSALHQALANGAGLVGTIEFFPEEGKYHFDGHRKCGVRWRPSETRRYSAVCSVCHRPVTVGVMHRVEELGDRPVGAVCPDARPFVRLLPLEVVLAEVLSCGSGSRRVQELYQQLLRRFGPELRILRELPVGTLREAGFPLLGEALQRMREGRLQIEAGFDGQYGKIRIFQEQERAALEGQGRLRFAAASPASPPAVTEDPQQKIEASGPHRPLQRKEARTAPDRHRADPLSSLNPRQREAVLHGDDPLMIVAGPGTGKTLTLSLRIAHLILTGRAPLQEILAVTFTQRAAQEMRERLQGLLNDHPSGLELRVQTLHAFGHQLLRRYGHHFGWLGRPFLLDENARMKLLLETLREECSGVSARSLPSLLEGISLWKQASGRSLPAESLVAAVGEAYDRKLRARGALDYDDLLQLPLQLLESHEDVREEVAAGLGFIFVDEYQDLNPLQVRLLKRLWHAQAHLTVIGDPDQSIYAFRGAEGRHFLEFPRDFPGARILRLAENYRSTRTLLKAATGVISHNPLPFPRALHSHAEEGSLVQYRTFDTHKGEAIFVAQEIDRLLGGTSHWTMHRSRPHVEEESLDISFGDVAVLYRVHALGDALEEALSHEGIPYQRYGEHPLRDFEDQEALLAGLRWIADPRRDEDLLRALSVPSVGLSVETIEALHESARTSPEGLWRRISGGSHLDAIGPGEQSRVRRQLQSLGSILEASRHSTVQQIFHRLMTSMRIRVPDSAGGRWDPKTNLLRHLTFTAERWQGDLISFLDHLSLQVEVDLYDPRADRITLLTIHAAKGLEFSVVFLVGLEEGILPYAPEGREVDLAEERRLFFVAITRARKLLYLTRARSRKIWGHSRATEVSRFLSEIPETLLQGDERSERKPARQLKLF